MTISLENLNQAANEVKFELPEVVENVATKRTKNPIIKIGDFKNGAGRISLNAPMAQTFQEMSNYTQYVQFDVAACGKGNAVFIRFVGPPINKAERKITATIPTTSSPVFNFQERARFLEIEPQTLYGIYHYGGLVNEVESLEEDTIYTYPQDHESGNHAVILVGARTKKFVEKMKNQDKPILENRKRYANAQAIARVVVQLPQDERESYIEKRVKDDENLLLEVKRLLEKRQQ